MSGRADYWSEHLAAIEAEGLTPQAYARREGLSVAALYYWRKRLSGAGSARKASPPARPFVAVQVGEVHEPVGCQLHLGAGVQLTLSQLPSPQWLAQLCSALAGPVR